MEPESRQTPAPWTPLLVLTLACLLITAWNLHLQTIANPDEPRYACPAREMLRGGDWIVPEFNARPRLLKPIGFYWLIAATGAAGQALGLDLTIALRLGPLLMGWLTVVATFLLGRRLAGLWSGLIAAVVLMTTWFFHQCSRDLIVDMTLTAFLTWAWLFCHIALERIQNSGFRIQNEQPAVGPLQPATGNWKPETAGGVFLPLLGFYVSLGLACMTKGPILVALFVVVPLVVYLAWSRRLKDLLGAGLWWGAPLALAVGLWWFVALWQQGHLKEVKGFFMTENVARAVGGKDHQKYTPFLFYLQDLGQNFAPWVILLPVAAWWSFKHWRAAAATPSPIANSQQPIAGDGDKCQVTGDKGEARGGIMGPVVPSRPLSDNARFLVCALGVPFLILGLAISKRALYLLPLYPLLALWVAWMWSSWLLAPGAWLLKVIPHAQANSQQPRAKSQEPRAKSRPWRLVLTASALSLVAMLWLGYEAVLRPREERADNRAAFYREVKEKLAGQPVVLLGLSSNEAVWYLDRPKEPVDDVRFPDLRNRLFDAPGTKLLVSQKILDKDAKLRQALKLEPLSEKRCGEQFFLADPDLEHPPAPGVFLRLSERASKAEGDE